MAMSRGRMPEREAWSLVETHWATTDTTLHMYSVSGGSGGVVNSLDFCPASLKSLGCFYFRCVLSSQWKAVKVNLRIFTANFKGIFGGP